MRDVLSNFLADKASENKNFYVFSGDHGYALFDKLRKGTPEKFINTGVTEQAMVGCAAGMAKTGKKVAVYGLASFIPMRVLEFIKMNICYERLPVIILGDGAGTVYTTLGASHQCGEDIACLRSLPVKIFSPADKFEMEACLNAAYLENMPSYIRIGKSDKPAVHTAQVNLKDIISVISKSKDTAIFATGSMVSTGVDICKEKDFSLYSCPVLSFNDKSLLSDELRKYKTIITLEEHSIHGGLGSMVADVIAEDNLPSRLIKFGIKDYFTKGAGNYEYAIKFHQLDKESILARLAGFNL